MGAATLRPPSEPALAAFTGAAAGAGAAFGADGAGVSTALLAAAGAPVAEPSSTVTS